jgi:hypothetical protein
MLMMLGGDEAMKLQEDRTMKL